MLDLQTLSISSVLASIISSTFFVLVWRLNHNERGVLLWLVALISQSIGLFLLSFRDHINHWFSVILANYLIGLSFLFFYTGLRLFYGKKKNNILYFFIFSILNLSSFWYFTFVDYSMPIRILLAYGSFIFLLSLSLWTITNTNKTQTTAGYLLITILSIIILLMLTRIITSIKMHSYLGLYDMSYSNYIGALTGFIIPYGFTLSFFLLCSERQIFQVKHLEKMAKNEAQMKNRLLATLSHEIRTPLNGILGKAQLMKNNPGAVKNDDLNSIIRAGHAMAELAGQVLTYAASTTTELKPIAKPIDIKKFITSVVEDMETDAVQKSISLSYKLDHSIPTQFHTDPIRLRQILINLLSNAIKYTDYGSVSLAVSCSFIKKNKVELKFSVSDSGIGIPLHEQSYIFDPFRRASNTTDKYEGTGLGLALCDQYLKSLDSKLDFHSREKKGSIFYFSIQGIFSHHSDNHIKTHQQSGPLKILLIEDIQLNIDIVTAMLAKNGHIISVANDIKSALHQLSMEKFDVVLLDMQLPDGDGINIVIELENLPLNQNTRVIALTASLTEQQLKSYQAHNITTILEKPVKESDLINVITKEDFITNISNQEDNQACNNSVQLFDHQPLHFLIHNMSEETLKEALHELPSRFTKDIFNLEIAIKNQDIKNQQFILHNISSYTGQVGLSKVSNEAKILESSSSILAISESLKLGTLFHCSINELMNYYENRI